jgi:hypothetical protein
MNEINNTGIVLSFKYDLHSMEDVIDNDLLNDLSKEIDKQVKHTLINIFNEELIMTNELETILIRMF